jgi:hypothetical protein
MTIKKWNPNIKCFNYRVSHRPRSLVTFWKACIQLKSFPKIAKKIQFSKATTFFKFFKFSKKNFVFIGEKKFGHFSATSFTRTFFTAWPFGATFFFRIPSCRNPNFRTSVYRILKVRINICSTTIISDYLCFRNVSTSKMKFSTIPNIRTSNFRHDTISKCGKKTFELSLTPLTSFLPSRMNVRTL